MLLKGSHDKVDIILLWISNQHTYNATNFIKMAKFNMKESTIQFTVMRIVL